MLRALVLSGFVRFRGDRLGLSDLGPRYLQLETIRQYAAEKLDDHQESSALRDRHLDWIVDHVTANAPVWVRPADPARVGELFEEEREILAAIAWAVTRPDADRALELCGRMGRAWVETGRWGSGLSVTLAALSLCTGDPELVAARSSLREFSGHTQALRVATSRSEPLGSCSTTMGSPGKQRSPA